MFFPIGDTQITGNNKPIVSYTLIAINLAIFIYQFLLPVAAQDDFVMKYATIPAEISVGKDYFTLITSMFLHGGIMHIVGNMLFLWVFADNIEVVIGPIKFLVFYLLGGIAAALAQVVLNTQSLTPCVGASGAIAACLGAYLVLFPKSKIKVFIIFIFSSISVPAFAFLGFWIVQQLFSGFGAIGSQKLDGAGGVAYWAHIGGFVFGVIAGLFFKKNIDNTSKANTDFEAHPFRH